MEKPPKTEFDSDMISLFSNEEAMASIKKILEEYLYWDKAKYQQVTNVSPERIWSAAKFRRLSGSKTIELGSEAFTFHITESMNMLLHQFDLELGGRLGASSKLMSEDKNRFLLSSIMEEAIASSMIEGAVTTRKEAKEMLRKKKGPKSISDRMIINNYNTIRFILENKERELSIDLLLEVHRSMCDGTLDDQNDIGKVRTSDDVNVVDTSKGEIVYRPPNQKRLPGLLSDYIDLFNHSPKVGFVHPIVMGSILHFLIGFIHPFVDGNGRTARAIFYWYLLKNGYWLMEYLSISRVIYQSKTQYEKAFLYAEYDGLDIGYFIHYQLRTLHLAKKELHNYLERKMDEKAELRTFQRIRELNSRQAQVLLWLEQDPDRIMTINEMASRMAVMYQTARRDLLGLIDLGFMEQIDLDKKSKGFVRASNFSTVLTSSIANG